ncbi:MAG: sigma-54 dependent transcriptional regulator [Acidobacteriota bacterium]
MRGPGESARILIVDDEPKMAEAIATALRRSGHVCATAIDGEDALRLFDAHGADVVVTDRRMPRMHGIELLDALRERDGELPVILVTAFGDVPSAVDAMRRGAFDYLTKPFDLDELRALVARALDLRRLTRENRRLRRALADERAGRLVAESAAMVDVLDWVDRAASSRATVLVTGESGTGKELVARRLHASSPRADGPFVAVNCAAFAVGVLESELFGHARGAFTGADSARRGCFERADGGTLLLDEIGEIDADFQAKLLRVLQEGEVQPVGSDEPVTVDTRVVAATRRDLRAAVDAGRFREDLYYRLNVLPVHLPPLRDRPDDIVPLTERILGRAKRHGGRSLALDPDAADALRAHPWPGNVRELENVLERAAVVARGNTLGVDDLLFDTPTPADADGSIAESDDARQATGHLQDVLDHAASERIRSALDDHDGRRADAARALGIDRTTLFRWIKRLDLDV